jgi:hypothetical protein
VRAASLAVLLAGCGSASVPPPRSADTAPRPTEDGIVVPDGVDVSWHFDASSDERLRADTVRLAIRPSDGRPVLVAGDLFLPLATEPDAPPDSPFLVPDARPVGAADFMQDGTLLVVVGRELGVAGPNGFRRLHDLPLAGMRVSAAAPDRCFLFGDGRVLIYRQDGTTLDLLRLPATDPSGAAVAIADVGGRPDRVLVAWGSALVVLAAGAAPTVLFDEGDGAVIDSIAEAAGGVFVGSNRGVTFVSDDGRAVVPVLRGRSAEVASYGDVLYAWIPGEGLLRFSPISVYADLAAHRRGGASGQSSAP